MSEQCQECGYQLPKNGGHCRVCRNKDRWEQDFYSIAESLFTKRITKNLQKLNIKPKEDHVKDIFEGTGLFLYGSAGTGKTLYACALALEIKKRIFIFPEVPLINIKFANVSNLLEDIRASFNRPAKQEHDESSYRTTEEIMNLHNNVGLLILDDLGAECPTEWSLRIIQIIINNRYEALLPTVITSNLGLKALSKQLDDRLSSRIYEMCEPVSFGKDDYRLKR